nr:unnamed protein product [Digitaria exilis]
MTTDSNKRHAFFRFAAVTSRGTTFDTVRSRTEERYVFREHPFTETCRSTSRVPVSEEVYPLRTGNLKSVDPRPAYLSLVPAGGRACLVALAFLIFMEGTAAARSLLKQLNKPRSQLSSIEVPLADPSSFSKRHLMLLSEVTGAAAAPSCFFTAVV